MKNIAYPPLYTNNSVRPNFDTQDFLDFAAEGHFRHGRIIGKFESYFNVNDRVMNR